MWMHVSAVDMVCKLQRTLVQHHLFCTPMWLDLFVCKNLKMLYNAFLFHCMHELDREKQWYFSCSIIIPHKSWLNYYVFNLFEQIYMAFLVGLQSPLCCASLFIGDRSEIWDMYLFTFIILPDCCGFHCFLVWTMPLHCTIPGRAS